MPGIAPVACWVSFLQGKGVATQGAGVLSPAARGRAAASQPGGCSRGAVPRLEAAVLLLCR